MKLKFSLIFSSFVFLFYGHLALADSPALSTFYFCPSPSQIVVDDINTKTATSMDGMWTGQNAIPAEYQDNWKQSISAINYTSRGYCQYFVNHIGAKVVELHAATSPLYHYLYDYGAGGALAANCWDINPSQQPQHAPTYEHPCYFTTAKLTK